MSGEQTKGQILQKTKLKSTVGKEEADAKIQNHMKKHELLDHSAERANLFPSEILGNTKINYDEHANRLHYFCLLIQDWGRVASLYPDLSTNHFPSMDV